MSNSNKIIEMRIKQNKHIWEETYRQSDDFEHQKAKLMSISEFSEKEISKIENFKQKHDKDSPKKPTVMVFENDILSIAEIMVNKGVRPLIINECIPNNPMEIVKKGAMGEEWDLFRRTNVINSIDMSTMYPLRDGRILYIPNVTVFKDEGFEKLRNPFQVSILFIPPVSRPGLISMSTNEGMVEKYQNSGEETRMKDSIEAMFKIAILKNHKCLITNDFGCQKNLENPIEQIIEFFNKSIEKFPIRYIFISVQEPILDRIKTKYSKSRKQKQKKYKNYELFNAKIHRHK